MCNNKIDAMIRFPVIPLQNVRPPSREGEVLKPVAYRMETIQESQEARSTTMQSACRGLPGTGLLILTA